MSGRDTLHLCGGGHALLVLAHSAGAALGVVLTHAAPAREVRVTWAW